MLNAERYLYHITNALLEKLDERLLYVGLQGSYLRGEATEESDIDIVVFIEKITPEDLITYRNIISALDEPAKSCGFICGREELQHWNPLEICNFLHGTMDYFGDITRYVPAYTESDVVNFIKLSASNLYHEITHRYVHADVNRNREALPHSYKNVFFILQSVYYLKTGVFYRTKQELLTVLSNEDKDVMMIAMELPDRDEYDVDAVFQRLFTWCQRVLTDF